jgi:2-phospho-L-lactate/phosphoenolpyruvate guanylyltransferase
MDVGLLPVKRLGEAKSRLEPLLGRAQRLALAAAMLEDALELCSRADFLQWYVLTADPSVHERARAIGLGTLSDDGEGDLNASLGKAIAVLGSQGAGSITVIPADAPLAATDEIRDLVDTGSLSDVVVVPAERDGGTNGLYLSPPNAIAPRFGESSLSAFVKEAEGEKLRCSILPLPGLALDIDTPEDVRELLSQANNDSRTVRLLRSWSSSS